ncbi:MAG: hypothetical protein ACI4RL_02745 [Ruminococcus sp.]
MYAGINRKVQQIKKEPTLYFYKIDSVITILNFKMGERSKVAFRRANLKNCPKGNITWQSQISLGSNTTRLKANITEKNVFAKFLGSFEPTKINSKVFSDILLNAE